MVYREVMFAAEREGDEVGKVVAVRSDFNCGRVFILPG